MRILWLPILWLLSVIEMFASLISFALGGGAGALLFGLIFKLPPQSGPLAMVCMAFILSGGFAANALFSKAWKSAIGRALHHIDARTHEHGVR